MELPRPQCYVAIKTFGTPTTVTEPQPPRAWATRLSGRPTRRGDHSAWQPITHDPAVARALAEAHFRRALSARAADPLTDLRRAAETKLAQPVERAVITLPAYFSDAARQATREAGEIAGFIVERIINEPTAAALAYGLDRADERQMVAVYDLGGGTFDVSIIELDSGVIEVRASHGNTQLGGDDFDERLRELLIERFVATHGVGPQDAPRAMARLLRAAEAAKIPPSTRPSVRIQEAYLLTVEGRPLHLETEVQREEFEAAIADLLDGTIESLDAALQDVGLSVDQLDKILFVGGSTRIPLVWELVREHTGIEPAVAINPDEAVALGAAVQAAIIAGEPLDAILVDVTSHSLGVEIAEFEQGRDIPDHYSVIIPRNTTVPTSRAQIYSGLYPGQEVVANRRAPRFMQPTPASRLLKSLGPELAWKS